MEKQHLLHQSLFVLFVLYTSHLQTTKKLSTSQFHNANGRGKSISKTKELSVNREASSPVYLAAATE
jgi:hypothetical protein